jgi:hypothetical protein
MSTGMNKPTLRQRIAYDLGAILPDSLHDWVHNDLVGHGAERRYLIRFLVPVVPVFLLVLLLPGPIWVRATMIAMMAVPMIVFTVSLSYVYRRFRLSQHGLDPKLLDRLKYSEMERDMYRQRFGHH